MAKKTKAKSKVDYPYKSVNNLLDKFSSFKNLKSSKKVWIVVLILHAAGFIISFTMQETQLPVVGRLAMRIPAFLLFTILTGKKPEEI